MLCLECPVINKKKSEKRERAQRVLRTQWLKDSWAHLHDSVRTECHGHQSVCFTEGCLMESSVEVKVKEPFLPLVTCSKSSPCFWDLTQKRVFEEPHFSPSWGLHSVTRAAKARLIQARQSLGSRTVSQPSCRGAIIETQTTHLSAQTLAQVPRE